ncbi:redoxin domain-containing protein [Patulibacter minatonensis]|uniref:redoxin domain-containing protein n=1 Tax=Patulibacter minatonensis TaxID=298163 RepID=UPI00047BD03D|nr:redoxin domain-containing protein [Patulibacter minatonensis]
MPLHPGDPFPSGVVRTTDGDIDLAERWADGPLVVAFHRLWCPFCHQSANELAAAREQLEANGASVVLVYEDDAEKVAGVCSDRGFPFDCANDPGRQLEQDAQLERFSAARYAAFAPTKLIGAFRSGARLAIPKHLLKGRGTYVVGTDGRVIYAHTSTTAADIPPIDAIVAATGEAAVARAA